MPSPSSLIHERSGPIGEYDIAPFEGKTRVARTCRVVFAPDAPTMKHPPRARSSLFGAIFVLLLGVLLGGLSYHRGFLLGEIAAVCATPLALYGLMRGGVRKALMLAAVLGACYAMGIVPALLTPLLASPAGSSAPAVSYLITAVVAMIGVVVVARIGKSLRNRLDERPILSMADRFFGAMIGTAEGGLIVLTLCWVCVLVRPHAERLRGPDGAPLDSLAHQLAGNIIRVAHEASIGPLGDFVRATNPINKVPALRQAIDGLNTTGRLGVSSLDPDLLQAAQRLLGSSPNGAAPDLNGLLDQYKKSAQDNNSADEQLPTPQRHP